MAVCDAAREVSWARNLLHELGFDQRGATTIFNDNMACVAMSNHDVNHSRAKHIDLRYYYVRELVEEKKISVNFVPSKENIADFLTKPLGRVLFNRLVNLAFSGAISSRGSDDESEKKEATR